MPIRIGRIVANQLTIRFFFGIIKFKTIFHMYETFRIFLSWFNRTCLLHLRFYMLVIWRFKVTRCTISPREGLVAKERPDLSNASYELGFILLRLRIAESITKHWAFGHLCKSYGCPYASVYVSVSVPHGACNQTTSGPQAKKCLTHDASIAQCCWNNKRCSTHALTHTHAHKYLHTRKANSLASTSTLVQTHTLSTLILRLICGCKCCCSWNYANFLVLYAASDTRETSNDGVEYPKPTCNMPWKDHEIYKQWDLWSPVRRPAVDNAALITPKWPLWWLNI